MFIQELDIPKFVMRRKSIDLQFLKRRNSSATEKSTRMHMGHGSVGISL